LDRFPPQVGYDVVQAQFGCSIRKRGCWVISVPREENQDTIDTTGSVPTADNREVTQKKGPQNTIDPHKKQNTNRPHHPKTPVQAPSNAPNTQRKLGEKR